MLLSKKSKNKETIRNLVLLKHVCSGVIKLLQIYLLNPNDYGKLTDNGI